jgi:hypothetical protein
MIEISDVPVQPVCYDCSKISMRVSHDIWLCYALERLKMDLKSLGLSHHILRALLIVTDRLQSA